MNSLPACIPVGRMGEVGEIADAILFLERAKFVTGETLTVEVWPARRPVVNRIYPPEIHGSVCGAPLLEKNKTCVVQ